MRLGINLCFPDMFKSSYKIDEYQRCKQPKLHRIVHLSWGWKALSESCSEDFQNFS